MKKLAIVSGIAMSTTMENSTGKDWKYNITSDSCKLCYNIFGKRTCEQCNKCKAGANKVTA